MRPRRGLSLVEVVVMIGLLALLTTFVYEVVVSAGRYFSVQKASLDAQKSCLLILNQVCTDLENTRPDLIRVSSSPATGVVMVNPLNDDAKIEFNAAGKVLWQRYVAYHLDGHRVMRQTHKLPAPDANPNPTSIPGDAVFAPLVTGTDASKQLSGDDVSVFSVILQPTPPSSPSVVFVYQVKIEAGDPGGDLYHMKMQSSVSPRMSDSTT